MELPVGTISFFMTDIERSTRLWEERPLEMERALQRHDEVAARIIALRDGVLVKRRGEGDSLFAVFDRPSDAVGVALEFQQYLLEHFDEELPIRVRTAVHTGEAEHRDGDYFGPAVNRCARLRAIGYGGQILLSRTAYDLARDYLPDEASVLPLGEVKLRDLDRPEEVFQLVHPSLPSDFPRPRAIQMNPNNLPAQPSSFVGRARELTALERILGQDRLVTVIGPTGSGKTRLALQAGADLLERFRDGVWFVELAPIQGPDQVPEQVLGALEIAPSEDDPMIALSDHLRNRSVLLILDNCEHVVLAAARLIDDLLRSCPQVRILATSQFALGIAGEQVFRILSLSAPERLADTTVESLGQYEAVKLFVERATEARPSFAVTNQNAPAVAEICYRLDGIPLAIELAAARVNVLTAEQIAERLDDRFRLLTGGSRTAMPRHQTLRAAVDWTYELLTDDERSLFRRLSVFRGGWTLDAAQEVCACENVDPYHVLDVLGQLADKSLVIVREAGEVARYSMLETLRMYAWDRLEEHGSAEEPLQRHATYYMRHVDEQTRDVPEDPVECIARLRQEAQNLQAAIEWLRLDTEANAGRPARGWAAMVIGAWQMERGNGNDAAQWLQEATEHLTAAGLTVGERYARRLLLASHDDLVAA